MVKIVDVLEYIQMRIAALFLCVFVISVALQVATRYIPGVSFPWTEAVSNYSFIWAVLMGSAIMVRKQEHFRLDILYERLTGVKRQLNNLFIHLLVSLFGLVMFYYGIKLTVEFWSWTVMSLPSLKQGYVWMAMPISGFTIIIYSLQNLISGLKDAQGEEGTANEKGVE